MIVVERVRFTRTDQHSADYLLQEHLNQSFYQYDRTVLSLVETNAGYASHKDPTTDLVWAEYLIVYKEVD